MKALFAPLITLFILGSSLTAQNTALIYSLQDGSAKADSIKTKNHQVLLNLYDGDIEQAMQDWFGLLRDIEKFAVNEEVNLNGVKLWMNVFFKEDGSIEAIGYHPKSDCKNMEWPVFEAMLKEFSKQYRFSKQSDQPFSHYGAAMWPTELLTGRTGE